MKAAIFLLKKWLTGAALPVASDSAFRKAEAAERTCRSAGGLSLGVLGLGRLSVHFLMTCFASAIARPGELAVTQRPCFARNITEGFVLWSF